MDCSDWSNGLGYHDFDTDPDTDFSGDVPEPHNSSQLIAPRSAQIELKRNGVCAVWPGGEAEKGGDPFGKKFFHNMPVEMNDNLFHSAIVTTVVHYTMAGRLTNCLATSSINP